MATKTAHAKTSSPVGRRASDGATARAARSQEYRDARDEYGAIRELRQEELDRRYIRERRFELDLTQQEVAERADTSHSYISRVEKGDHLPTLAVLRRILAVLDEELLVGIVQRATDDGEEPEREIAPRPELAA